MPINVSPCIHINLLIRQGHFQMSAVSRTNMHEDNMSLGLDLDLDLDQDLDMDMDLDLFEDQTEVINQLSDNLLLTCTMCAFTISVNIWAMKVLTTREDHCITRLVKLDCVSNILLAVEALIFNLDVGFPLNISAICAVRNATTVALTVFTRLVPVAIVLLRYIMVCHPARFINWGREKGVWKWILGSVIVLSLAFWFYNLYYSSIAFRFLRCVGREEAFW